LVRVAPDPGQSRLHVGGADPISELSDPGGDLVVGGHGIAGPGPRVPVLAAEAVPELLHRRVPQRRLVVEQVAELAGELVNGRIHRASQPQGNARRSSGSGSVSN
jgi:hypothetical protein